jgi:hypothetical protein
MITLAQSIEWLRRSADGEATDMTRADQRCASKIRCRVRVNFNCINRCALAALPMLLERWLPGGRREGWEYVALNPTRPDRHLGSFRINVRTGRWADFATGDRGSDVVSLAAYLSHLKQSEAAEKLAGMLGIAPEARYGR